LYNNNDFDIDLTEGDYYMHIGTAGAWHTVIKLEGIIPAKCSFLVASTSETNSTPLTTAASWVPDQTAAFTIANGNHMVFIVRNRATLTAGSNPFADFGPYTDDGDYIDGWGMGSATGFEGARYAGGQSAPRVPRRTSLNDTDNNNTDFLDVDYRSANQPAVVAELYKFWPRNSTQGPWDPITGLPRIDPVLRVTP